MPLRFEGTAHPPPSLGYRVDQSDLNSSEIASVNLGSRGKSKYQTPVLNEHEGHPVGRVLSSWKGPEGQLRIQATVNDATTEHAIRSGEMLGLSLGTRMVHDPQHPERVKVRSIEEVSVVECPRRDNCYITAVDGIALSSQRNRASKRTPLCPLGAP